MKFLIQVTLTILSSYLAAQLMPWWSLFVCAALVAMSLNLNQSAAFWDGFVAISLPWMGVATFIDVQTEGIIFGKAAPLFGFQYSFFADFAH